MKKVNEQIDGNGGLIELAEHDFRRRDMVLLFMDAQWASKALISGQFQGHAERSIQHEAVSKRFCNSQRML